MDPDGVEAEILRLASPGGHLLDIAPGGQAQTDPPSELCHGISIIVIVGQHARADRIRQMFDQVAPRYDARNRLFSLNRDHAWRRRAARRAGLKPGDTALDLCTGTGKLAHELLNYVRPGGLVVGIDFSPAMLERARKLEPGVEFRLGDVSRLTQPDASVDAITIGFGLRNLLDRTAGLREMFRVLRPGGLLVILEFAPPPPGLLMRGYRFYLERVMPAAVGLRSAEEASAYRYLADTVQAFTEPLELAQLLERLGFRVAFERMTFGIVAIHTATKPSS
ncbi:MAG: ubiquinone/menaquinone biosynthesis methyltransferase [Chloroflexi bacterium]|nr:MAG: ubiquinone/menaquinone biosynthesis methyltransferase [Chloroflexota bacterium]TME48072.1 MAG: ubiquinone/menaquinone biosynthesis methyltransferase [Chloroflexota bacterium]